MSLSLFKWLALAAMVADHSAVFLGWSASVFWSVGRLAFPLFVFLAAYSTLYLTRDWRRYALRLLVVALVSQPVTVWAFEREWWNLNVLFSLALVVLVARGVRIGQPLFVLAAVVVSPWVEFGPMGLAGAFFLCLVMEGKPWFLVPAVAGFILSNGALPYSFSILLGVPLVVGVLLLQEPFDCRVKRSRVPAWVFYVFYPVHVLALAWISA